MVNFIYEGCSIKTVSSAPPRELTAWWKSTISQSKACFIPSLSALTLSPCLILFSFYACLSNIALIFAAKIYHVWLLWSTLGCGWNLVQQSIRWWNYDGKNVFLLTSCVLGRLRDLRVARLERCSYHRAHWSEYCYAWTLLERGDLSRKEKKDREGPREIRLLR